MLVGPKEKTKKIIFNQNENINKDRQSLKLTRNSGAEKFN
jgi:hypothetical protein